MGTRTYLADDPPVKSQVYNSFPNGHLYYVLLRMRFPTVQLTISTISNVVNMASQTHAGHAESARCGRSPTTPARSDNVAERQGLLRHHLGTFTGEQLAVRIYMPVGNGARHV